MKKILIVDDERDIESLYRQYFRKSINEQKLSLQFAFSGSEALEMIGNQCDPELIMLTDINMPGMTGLELLQKVKEKCPKAMVYVVSAYDTAAYHTSAKEFGAEEFITKPIDFLMLKEKLVNINL